MNGKNGEIGDLEFICSGCGYRHRNVYDVLNHAALLCENREGEELQVIIGRVQS